MTLVRPSPADESWTPLAMAQVDAPVPGADEVRVDTTPAWAPVVEGLRRLAPGGRLVVNAIRKEARDQDARLRLDYASDLWMERQLVSVANVTIRRGGQRGARVLRIG